MATPEATYDETPAEATALEVAALGFLTRKYVQYSQPHHRQMGLQYMEAETHDLAREVARFVEHILAEKSA